MNPLPHCLLRPLGGGAGVPGLVLLLGAVPHILGVLLGVLGNAGDHEVPPLGLELANR